MPGLGAEVLRRLGAIVVLLPGGEIVPALKSGAIDASEWNGPWLDMAFGLHKAAGYYYFPGFHEPGTNLAVGINRAVWDSLDASDRHVIEAMAACEYARSLAEFNANNALSLRKLRDEGTVKILKFDNFYLRPFSRSARTSSPRSAPATTFPGKSIRATSSSGHRSWIGATSPNARSSIAAGSLNRALAPQKSSLWSLTHLCQFDILLASAQPDNFEEQ